MSDIKIAYILSKFPAFTETFIIREIKEIRKRGIGVFIFSLKNLKSTEIRQQIDETIYKETYYLPYFFSLEVWKAVYYYIRTKPSKVLKVIWRITRSNLGSPLTLLKSLAILPKAIRISKILKDSNIDKVHAHWATVPTTVAWIISMLNGTNYSFTTHAWDIFTPDNMLQEKIHSSSNVITISDYNKNYLASTYLDINPEKIKVIHVGVDLNKFKPQKNSENSVFTILSIGRLIEKKGFRYLLESCDELRKKNIKFKCQIIYAGSDKNNEIFDLYKKLELQNHVEFISNVTEEKILAYYNRADCFVLPCVVGKSGDRDGIPTVIIEALAMEVPVVSTTVSGIPEIVEDRKTGLLVKPRDVEKLTHAIEELYKSRELRMQMGKSGRSIVEEKFDIRRNIDNLLELIL